MAEALLDAIGAGLLLELPVGVIVAEAPSGRIVLANGRAEEIWRHAPVHPDSTAGNLGYEGFHPDGRPYAPDEWPLARTVRTGRPVDAQEIDFIRGDGTRGTMRVSSAPIRDAAGSLRAAVVVFSDVSAEVDARRTAERLAAELRFLAEASELLSGRLDVERTLEQLAFLAVPRLADWCSIDLKMPGGRIRNVGVAHFDPAKVALARRLQEEYPATDPAAPSGSARVIRTGLTEHLPDIPDELVEAIPDARLREIVRELGLRSAITAPLRAHGRTVGALTLISAESGRRFGDDDVRVAEDLARRAAIALDNARLYEEARTIAETLQRSLLPSRLPELPGIEIGCVYRPAGEGNEVGGDFFDVWEIAEGRFGAAIGDVCGKGAPAAAVTALARHTARTASLTLPDPLPSAVLPVVNQALIRRAEEQRFCTMAYLDGRRSGDGVEICAGIAGHPPPLVVRADGRIEHIAGSGMLLGLFEPSDVDEERVQLGRGDALVMLTDGVTERRRGRELFGNERVEATLAGLARRPAQQIAEGLELAAAEFAPGARSDDVAILALSLPGR